MPPVWRFSKSLSIDSWSDWSEAENWDRRSNDRIRVALAVRQRVRDEIFLCQASNLSPSGMFLARPKGEWPEYHPKCWLEFGLPGIAEVIAVRGQIVREADRGPYHVMAVWFTSMAPSHRRRLNDFLRANPEHELELQAFEAY